MFVNAKDRTGFASDALGGRGASPRHALLADQVRSRITSGEWRPGDMLPSETALIEAFEVSRTVVRQAMQTLETEGLIYRRSGKGTFVREPSGALFSGTPIASVDDLVAAGQKNTLVTLQRTEVAADEVVAAALRLAPGDLVTLRTGVRSYGGRPFAFQMEHIPVEIGRRTMAAEQVDSFFENFRSTSGIDIVEMTQSASAVAADPTVAERLELSTGDPVLQIDWTVLARDGRPVVFARTRYRSDRYRHVNRIPMHASSMTI